MKYRSIKTLYRIFSFLSDKTNGFKPFVKYKLLLGTLLIGISATACKNKPSEPTCYELAAIPDDIIMCYEPAAPEDTISAQEKDSIVIEKKKVKSPSIIISAIDEPPIAEPMCYEPATPVITCYKPVIRPVDTFPELPPMKEVYAYVEQMPSFPGGDAVMIRYISERLNYPIKKEDEEDITGRVILRFIVRSTGEIDSIEIVRSLTPEFDKEAIRIVESMPKWIPGKQDEKEVDVYYTIPIDIHWK